MTTQALTTYHIQFRRPAVDGLHGYEGPAWTTETVHVTLCERDCNLGRFGLLTKSPPQIGEGASCDVCADPGQGLFAIIIERVLRT